MKFDTISNQPVIETERFDLRPLRRSDMGLIEYYAGEKRVARMTTSIPHPLPPGTVETMIKRAQMPDRVEDIWALDGSAGGHAEVDTRYVEVGQCIEHLAARGHHLGLVVDRLH